MAGFQTRPGKLLERSKQAPEMDYRAQYERQGLTYEQRTALMQHRIHESMVPLLHDLRNYAQAEQQRSERWEKERNRLTATMERQTQILAQQMHILNRQGEDVRSLKEALKDERARMAEQRAWDFCRLGWRRFCQSRMPQLKQRRPVALWRDRWSLEAQGATRETEFLRAVGADSERGSDADLNWLVTCDFVWQVQFAWPGQSGFHSCLLAGEVTANADLDGTRAGKVAQVYATLRRLGNAYVLPLLFTQAGGQVSRKSQATGTLHFQAADPTTRDPAWEPERHLDVSSLLRRHLGAMSVQ